MLIDKRTFTTVALKLVEPHKAFDREFLAKDVARVIAERIYNELGGTQAMTMLDLECLKRAFESAARSLIDYGRCSRKVEPEDYADSIGYNAWPEPINPKESL